MQHYQKITSSAYKQQGFVMLVALIFLILTSLIALTTMKTSILEIKMAGNEQLQEEAAQIVEGVTDQIIFQHDDRIYPTLPLNNFKEGEKFCKKNSADTECLYKTMYITPEFIANIATMLPDGTVIDAVLNYWAYRRSSLSTVRSVESSAGGVLHVYFEVFAEYKASPLGFSDSSLSVGFDKKTLDLSGSTGGSPVSVKEGADGAGAGVYRML